MKHFDYNWNSALSISALSVADSVSLRVIHHDMLKLLQNYNCLFVCVCVSWVWYPVCHLSEQLFVLASFSLFSLGSIYVI